MDMQEILKQLRALSEGDAECNKSDAGKYCPVHGMEECSMTEDENRGVDDLPDDSEEEEARDHEYYKAIKSGGEIPEEVVEPDRFIHYYEQKYGINNTDAEDDLDLKEQATVNISFDGPEAEAWITRLSELAGQPIPEPHEPTLAAEIGVPMEADMPCEQCGHPMSQCTCVQDDTQCPECGSAECECANEPGTVSFGPNGIEMEEEHDFGHVDHSDTGEPVDVDTYMYKAPNGEQRIVKGMMGDNSLIKEDANKLYAKLKGDYRAYIAEAELAASNAAGAQSPLTATNRDDFEKDPFADDEAITDGSHSPLSTIKRQKVLK